MENSKQNLTRLYDIRKEVEAQHSYLKEQAALALELDSINLPEIYRENPVPDLDLLSIRNTFFSLIPMLDIFILFDDPLLLPSEKIRYQTVSTIQFGTGLLFQLSLAALLLFDDTAVRTAGVITAIATGGTSIGLGVYAGIEWGGWTKSHKALKSRYDILQKRLTEISDVSLTSP